MTWPGNTGRISRSTSRPTTRARPCPICWAALRKRWWRPRARPRPVQTALEMVAPLGRVAVIGLSGGKPTPVTFDTLVFKGVRIISDHAQAGQMEEAMRIINSGRYAIEKINNVHYRLEDLKQALKDTSEPPPGFIKGAVVFD